jgi:Right handed beta helix region
VKNLAFFSLVVYAMSAGAAHGATYYVSKPGNDSNSCAKAQSISSPKRTINAGIACLAAGDTLLVGAGTYDEGIRSVPSGTSWSNKVRIAAYPGATVWLKPSVDAHMGGGVATVWLDGNYHYIEFDGINMDGSLTTGQVVWISTNNMNNPHHVRIANAEIIAGVTGAGGAVAFGGHTNVPGGATGANEAINLTIHGGGVPGGCGFMCSSYGIYLEGPNNIVDGCNIYDTASFGLQIYNAGGDSPDNNIVRNTRFHDILRSRSGYADGSGNGMLIAGNNNQIYNNLFYGLTVINGAGINVYYGTGNKIWNNTIFNNTLDGISIGTSTTSRTSNTVAGNNIIYQNSGRPVVDLGTSTVTTTNLSGVNPLFVNPGTGNLALTAGSPAIDAGTSSSIAQTDFTGIARPQGSAIDIGAFEYSATTTSLKPPPVPQSVRVLK